MLFVSIAEINQKLTKKSYSIEYYATSLLSLISNGFITNGINRNNSFVIGIDCGTESARVGLFNCFSGELISSGFSEYRTGTTFPRPGVS